MYQELRRQSHITAEQKRRGSIKNGFEQLQSLVINPSQHPSGKVSKAVLLEKSNNINKLILIIIIIMYFSDRVFTKQTQ